MGLDGRVVNLNQRDEELRHWKQLFIMAILKQLKQRKRTLEPRYNTDFWIHKKSVL